ncbi:MAG: hypothetical protein AB7O59_19465 [Pirellulales bacterium]
MHLRSRNALNLVLAARLAALMLALGVLGLPPVGAARAADAPPFAIQVVDDATGRGVPLVELTTVNQVLYVTDSAGLAAIDEPGLVQQKVFFHVRSHGYEYPADGFGYRGKALEVVPGETATLRLKRTSIAERLYRVTGADIYRDSVLLGRAVPIAQPLLNAQVVGSDSVNTAVYRGRVYWFWGDTNRTAHPLGMFHVPGATSRLLEAGGLPVAQGVNLEYFTRDDGFVAATCEMPGEGPTWIDGLCVLRAADGEERMFARYMKVRKFLEVYERGLVAWNDATRKFDKVAAFDFEAPLYPQGHALAHEVDGIRYIYFGNPYPLVRVRADAQALADTSAYEAFTCLAAGSTPRQPKFNRDENGAIVWSWQRGVPAPLPREQAQWLRRGLLKDAEAALALRDVDTGTLVIAHAGSVAWNAFRRRFVMIAEQAQGTSPLGEVWYAEADAPTGPWVYARKIATHDKYSFYNPRQHPMFDAEGGRRIYFEGTYSTFFSGNDSPTPRYDYNQIMYALDLGDERTVLPVVVYQWQEGARQQLATTTSPAREAAMAASATAASTATQRRIAFMALDRPRADSVAVVRQADSQGTQPWAALPANVATQETDRAKPVFFALPHDMASPPRTSVPLFVWTRKTDGQTYLAIDGESPGDEYQRAAKPLCRVWRYPLAPRDRFE